MKRPSLFPTTRGLCVAALLTALSVVIGVFCKNFLNFGNGLFRITFENIPILLSGFLFGPIIGALVGTASDLLSYLLSAQTYPPNLVVTAGAASIGLFSGLLYNCAFKKATRTSRIIIAGIFSHAIGSMIIKPIGLYQFYGIAVLVRIPLYLLIAPLEIIFLVWLFKKRSFNHLIGEL